jgi:hypothetical protein
MSTDGSDRPASAGHRLGQLIGDWLEQHFALPLLQDVADRLRLYLDHRFKARPAVRGDKIAWADEDGNEVDYDFVMELEGTDGAKGSPVAFLETFWRRGLRHSKDKARDDSGKLRPMRDVYPTARFLGIIAGGVFTGPSSAFLTSKDIDLFYLPKAKIVAAFKDQGIAIDYPDRTPEAEKLALLEAFERVYTPEVGSQVAQRLRELVGSASLSTYVDRVRGALGALPQEIRFIERRDSPAMVFETIAEATAFLADPRFASETSATTYVYQITYSDGTDFERGDLTLEALKELHGRMEKLADHVASLQPRENQ